MIVVARGFVVVSANQYGLDLEELTQLVGDPDEGDFRCAHIDLLSGTKQLVALCSLQELLRANLTQQLLRGSRAAVDLF